MCSRDNVWPPTLITRTKLCRTSPNDPQRLASDSVSFPRSALRSPSHQCRVLLGSVSLFFSYPQREGNLILSHPPNLTKHGRKKAVKLKFKPLSFVLMLSSSMPRTTPWFRGCVEAREGPPRGEQAPCEYNAEICMPSCRQHSPLSLILFAMLWTRPALAFLALTRERSAL